MVYDSATIHTDLLLKHVQTPATCANIALNDLWPGKIDLVVSVPDPLPSHYLTGLALDIRSQPGPEHIWSV